MLQATNGFSEMIMLQSLPVTGHEQTPDFYRLLAILLEVNRLRRDLLSFVFLPLQSYDLCVICVCLFLFPLLSVWEKMEWNGQKQTNKQIILEAVHRDHEMVIEAFPIWWGTVFTIFGHLKTFISRNRNLLRSARPIFLCCFCFCYKKNSHKQIDVCQTYYRLLNVQSAGSRLYLINVTCLWK